MADLPLYRRTGLTLVPANGAARVEFAKLIDGAVGVFERRNPRSMAQHRAYFAMLNNVAQASGQWPSREALEFDLAVALKAGDIHTDRWGNAHFRPWSRAVSAMSKEDFELLHRNTVALLTEWLGTTPDMLMAEAA